MKCRLEIAAGQFKVCSVGGQPMYEFRIWWKVKQERRPRPHVSEEVRCAEQRGDGDGNNEALAMADVGERERCEGERW